MRPFQTKNVSQTKIQYYQVKGNMMDAPPGKFGSSSSLWNSATNTWRRSSSAEGLLSGLKWRQACSTSKPSGVAEGKVSGIVR